MQSWAALPECPLRQTGEVTAEFLDRDIRDLRAAGRYLQALPYGRTAAKANYRDVLREGQGTCSTKHALLAALAQEQEVDVTLMLGIYDMHEGNTPGVGVVLAEYELLSIPEAHCYVRYDETRIDITRVSSDTAEAITQFWHEESIRPGQIGDYKARVHRQFMTKWGHANQAATRHKSVEELWHIREMCIAALAS